MAGFDIVQQLSPDIVGHITGGPIPMPEEDVVKIVTETDQYLEICSSGNLRMAARLIEVARDQGAFGRVLVGTDTPGGTGVIPRGMLREIGFLSSVAAVPPPMAIAMATGNVGRAHGLPIGLLKEGSPADLVLLDRIQGSVAEDALDSFAKGDLPGVSVVITDGVIRISGRSQQTPPPERPATIQGG